MSMKKLEEISQNNIRNLCGLYLEKGEKNRLYNICIKYGIHIMYPRLFEDDTHYYLWGIGRKGIGLISTVIMNYLSNKDGIIFQSLDDLEQYLIKQKSK